MTETAPATSETGTAPPGTVIWIDLGSRDPSGSADFYHGLFGWEREVIPDPNAGGYGFFNLDGQMAAGVGPLMDPNAPSAWTVYFATDDTEETARKVRDAGGQVVFGPMDVMGTGIMAICADPTGAFFGLWQPMLHTGMRVRNQPGSFAWAELNTRDMAAARSFYAGVFGWGSNEYEGDNPYTEWTLNGESVGGGWNMTGRVPDEVPPHWLTYFAVTDCDASLARAQELGAETVVPAMDIPQGRFSVIRDPQGATLAIIAFQS